MGNLPFLWIVKIGITGNLDQRLEAVNKENQGFDFYLFYIWIPFAWQVEQWVHEKMSFFRVNWFRGTGRTERFWFLAIIPTIIGGLIVKILQVVFILLMFGAVLLLVYFAGNS